MKNVKSWQLKTCIFMDMNEFDEIIKKVVSENIVVSYGLIDGIYFENKNNTEEFINEQDIYKKLAKYFDVKTITSIHIDDFDIVGVWICYHNWLSHIL